MQAEPQPRSFFRPACDGCVAASTDAHTRQQPALGRAGEGEGGQCTSARGRGYGDANEVLPRVFSPLMLCLMPFTRDIARRAAERKSSFG